MIIDRVTMAIPRNLEVRDTAHRAKAGVVARPTDVNRDLPNRDM